MGTRGVRTRGHSGWVAILGGGARGRRARTEFELSGYSVFSVLRLTVRGRLVQAMVLAPSEDVCSRHTQNEVLIIRRSDKRSSVAVIIIWQLQRFMSDAESPDMDGKLQVYRLEKRKGEVDDANIIAGKRVRPQGPAPIVSAAPRTVAPRRVSPKKAAPSPDVPGPDDTRGERRGLARDTLIFF